MLVVVGVVVVEATAAAAAAGQHMAVAAVTSFLCFTHGEDG
jgi:hypothetical protein